MCDDELQVRMESRLTEGITELRRRLGQQAHMSMFDVNLERDCEIALGLSPASPVTVAKVRAVLANRIGIELP